MDQSAIDTGTITALMIRLKEYRLPRAKRLLEKVSEGDLLGNEDIAFLERVYNDSMNIQPLVKRHPEYHEVVVGVLNLYTEIINKGLENEKA